MDNIREKDQRDRLLGALIGLARVIDNDSHAAKPATWYVIIRGAAAAADESCAEDIISGELRGVSEEKHRLAPNCASCVSPCGRTDDYDMSLLSDETEDVRALKARILNGALKIAMRAREKDDYSEETGKLIARALFTTGENWEVEWLLPIAEETEKAIED